MAEGTRLRLEKLTVSFASTRPVMGLLILTERSIEPEAILEHFCQQGP